MASAHRRLSPELTHQSENLWTEERSAMVDDSGIEKLKIKIEYCVP